jgi:hypothetical protein
LEDLLSDIKRLLESIEGQSEWFKDKSTASKLLEELSRVNDNLASVNTNLEVIQALAATLIYL